MNLGDRYANIIAGDVKVLHLSSPVWIINISQIPRLIALSVIATLKLTAVNFSLACEISGFLQNSII